MFVLDNLFNVACLKNSFLLINRRLLCYNVDRMPRRCVVSRGTLAHAVYLPVIVYIDKSQVQKCGLIYNTHMVY